MKYESFFNQQTFFVTTLVSLDVGIVINGVDNFV